METFTRLTSIAASLPDANIDTDIIFPARFLVITAKLGLGQYAFYEKRFDAQGNRRDDFVLNREPFCSARILVAGDNFGCGSSREQAPWALMDFGLRCIISTSFGEIFYSNCFKNGMLPIVVSPDQLAILHAQAGRPITIDLESSQIILEDAPSLSFEVPDWRRKALLNGWDEIDMILEQDGARIAEFETAQAQRMPWLYTR